MKRIKKLLILLASAMLCYSCTSDTEYNITNIHNDIIVMGHGGMGFFHHYPLNTFESIMNCINLGAEGTEIDVQISRDNVLYAFHNRDLKDDTNLEGLIREKTSEELDACFYNNQASGEFRLARLDKILERLSDQPQLRFSFDCKLNKSESETPEQFYTDFATAIRELHIGQYLLKRLYVESSDPAFLAVLKAQNPLVSRFYYASSFDDAVSYLQQDPVRGITISGENITATEITTLHNMGVMVALFGAKSANGNIDQIKRNPDIIQSDYVKHLINELD